MKLPRMIFTAAATLLLTTVSHAQIALTDTGAASPSPGANDISQLSNAGNIVPAGLNYYWDDGYTTPGTGAPGQTFTTLSNPQGYILTSVAIKTAGLANGGGNGGASPFESQPFTLRIFQLSDGGVSNTLIASYTATGQLIADGDWMEWTGLGVPLPPGTNYAFTFGISAPPGGNDDWESISVASGLPYSGGQVCLAPNAGGRVKYATDPNTYDMTFDLGISLPAAPIANPPLESPSTADIAVLAGTSVTLSGAAGGSAPITFIWQTDGGSGGTLTNIPGGTGANLVVNTTGFIPGTYNYDFLASNTLGTNLSTEIAIKIVSMMMVDIGPNAPTPGAVDISQLLNSDQNDDGFNYYTDNGANHNEWNGQTFTTGSNPSGYVMNSLAWKSDGNGNSFPDIQLYDLYVYSLSAGGTTATPIASYQMYGGGTELDWQEWVGINVPLAPNSQYAYAFGRDSTSTGWEHIGNQGDNPYAGGQICQIPSAGGTVTYGPTGDSDATFDIGLSVSEAPSASLPSYSPNVTPVYAGTPVTLLESAVGAPPLSYQWLADNGTGTLSPVSGATSTNLGVNTASFAPGNYEYEVIVTNSHGTSTSAVLTLSFVAASEPVLETDITPGTLNEGYVGETLTYSATFTGTLPITYQWMLDTGSGPAPIPSSSNPSAISNTLVLTNLQLGSAGTYTLAANNLVGGPVSSSASTLTVLADPGPPSSGTYAAMVLGEDPVAYWRLNETGDPSTGVLPAYDATGHNFDGLYGMNGLDGFDGVEGPQPPSFPGFEANNTAFEGLLKTTNSWINAPPINLDTNAVTIAMWINPSAGEAVSAGLLMNRNVADAAGFCFGTVANSGGMAELGYTWNTNSAATYNFNSGLYPLAGQWSFVALVVQPTQATIYLYYIDPNTGLPDLYSAVNPIAHYFEPFSGGTTWIGDDQNSINRVFYGDIDEVAVFNKALTSDQILLLFSKAAGLSEVAATIAGEPQSAAVYTGTTVSFTATGVNGTPPLTYQWQFNGTNLANGGNISGATNTSLTISDVTEADVGSYQLFVTNPVSVTPSSLVTLTVVTPVPGSYESAVLADGPLLYWKLDETNSNPGNGGVVAYDYVHGYNGVYQTAAENGYNGILGPQAPQFPGFPSNNTAMETFSNTADSYMTASAGNLTASNLTYAMWINPNTNVENWAGLLMDRGGPGEGLGFGGDVSASGMSDLGYTWDQNSTWNFSTYLYPPTNQWSFVAMVIEPSQGTVYLINSNGVQSAVNAIPHDTEEFGVAWHLGNDAQDGGNGTRTFPGSISSASVYLSALSSNQLVALYDGGVGIAAPVTVNIAPAGEGSLTLSWSQGTLLQTTNLAGPWTTNTAPSPYTIAPTNSHMYFKVLVN